MSRSDQVYLNGRILGRAEAAVTPFDRGFLYGDGFFETTRILDGKGLFIGRHLQRLAASCRETSFGPAPDAHELASATRRLIQANSVETGYLRITVSRGTYRGRLAELAAGKPTVLIEARPMELPPLDAPPALTLARSPYRRNEHSPVVRHKSLSYQVNVLALAEGRGRGADEVYFLNSQDHLTEGAITNLFLVTDGAVLTPDVECGLLPGVTRRVVLEICRDEGVATQVGVYGEVDLQAADELFCTNSLRGIMAVERILDCPTRELASHPLTERLQHCYAKLARED
ncbi:MAG: aminotransferase class IV [Planctomycetota bacterium]|jgi:branched-subunit amino acid aminotransferase/4-amino-4-deoxychorismate lyase